MANERQRGTVEPVHADTVEPDYAAVAVSANRLPRLAARGAG